MAQPVQGLLGPARTPGPNHPGPIPATAFRAKRIESAQAKGRLGSHVGVLILGRLQQVFDGPGITENTKALAARARSSFSRSDFNIRTRTSNSWNPASANRSGYRRS